MVASAAVYPPVAVGGLAAYGTLFVCAFGSLFADVARSINSGNCTIRHTFSFASGAFLTLNAACRVAWTAMAFHPKDVDAFLKAAALDSIASFAWNAWVAVNISIALPSGGAQASPLGIWRDGKRWARYNRVAFVLWFLLNFLITVPEILCLLWYSNDEVLMAETDFMCLRVGRVDTHIQGGISLAAAIVIWLLRRRLLKIVKELDAPLTPSIRALLRGMVMAALLLCVRSVTLVVAAGFVVGVFCPGMDTSCRNSSGADHITILVLGYWLPECLLPLTGAVLGWKAYSARKERVMAYTASSRLDRSVGTRRRIVGNATALLTSRSPSRRFASMRRHPFSQKRNDSINNSSQSLLSSRRRGMSSEEGGVDGRCSVEKERASVELTVSSREDATPRQRRVTISTEGEPPRAHAPAVRFTEAADESTAPGAGTHRRSQSVKSIVDSVRASTSGQALGTVFSSISSIPSSLKLRGSLLDRQQPATSVTQISRHAYQYAARNGTLVDVLEVMEESHFVWQVAAAYLPLVQSHMRKQMDMIRKELRSEVTSLSQLGLTSPPLHRHLTSALARYLIVRRSANPGLARRSLA